MFDFVNGETLLINKPVGWTSFDVVKKIRNLIKKHTALKKLKVGHAGTLDPLAEGLLIICTGKKNQRNKPNSGTTQRIYRHVLFGSYHPIIRPRNPTQ